MIFSYIRQLFPLLICSSKENYLYLIFYNVVLSNILWLFCPSIMQIVPMVSRIYFSELCMGMMIETISLYIVMAVFLYLDVFFEDASQHIFKYRIHGRLGFVEIVFTYCVIYGICDCQRLSHVSCCSPTSFYEKTWRISMKPLGLRTFIKFCDYFWNILYF